MLPLALDRLFKGGVRRESRNGPVLQLPGPTILCYERPMERVIFWPERDANPFFHLMEALWMLEGRRDVEPMAYYASRMKDYSDDGKVFNGAYGHRWRKHFGIDQLPFIISRLRKNPDDRRQVLGMWDPMHDCYDQQTVDLPCNTHIYFARNETGALDMTVCNRSNDLVWGALGANVVHMSFLQEHVANGIGCAVGKYYQFTNNLHGYLATAEPLRCLTERQGELSPYGFGEHFMSWPMNQPTFGTIIVEPMKEAFRLHKEKQSEKALDCLHNALQGARADWLEAGKQWIQRRITYDDPQPK
jgi:thymidylate synthase